MKFCILTTDTAHHAYFINKIQERFDISYIVYETKGIEFNYDTESKFNSSEDLFESKVFFNGRGPEKIKAPIFSMSSVNNPIFLDLARKYEVDFAIVFGCGKIKPHVFSLFPEGMINIHRGVVSRYRGLDSDLWAAYNNDFFNIGVTLHYIEEELDAGPVIFEGAIDIPHSCKIYELRARTTFLATTKILEILVKKDKGESVIGTRQNGLGEYYSAMSTEKKEISEKRFNDYAKRKIT